MNKAKGKVNAICNKHYTKRRDNIRKNMNITGKRKTRNLRKKRRNVTRRRHSKKILGGEVPLRIVSKLNSSIDSTITYDDNYFLTEDEFDDFSKKNDISKDNRIYITKNETEGANVQSKNFLDFLSKKYFFIDYSPNEGEVGKMELGYYKGFITNEKSNNMKLLSFLTKKEIETNIPLLQDGHSNINKLYYYPSLTSRIKSGIDSFRSTLPNYPTFSLGISSNKNIVSEVVKNDKDDLRKRTNTTSTDASSTDSNTSNIKEKTYNLITSIHDMEEKIIDRYSFAKLDDNGNYIDYSLCRKSRRNDEEFLCDIDDMNTDTIQAHHIDNKKIFYLEK